MFYIDTKLLIVTWTNAKKWRWKSHTLYSRKLKTSLNSLIHEWFRFETKQFFARQNNSQNNEILVSTFLFATIDDCISTRVRNEYRWFRIQNYKMIQKINVYKHVNDFFWFFIMSFEINFLDKNNRRHVYNIKDHLKIDLEMCKIAQFFSHIYRRQTYDFVMMFIVKRVRKILIEKNFYIVWLNSIFNLSIYRLLSRIDHETCIES